MHTTWDRCLVIKILYVFVKVTLFKVVPIFFELFIGHEVLIESEYSFTH